MAGQTKAGVSVSCGQRPREMDVVRAVSNELERLGFDVYIAKEESSLAGLKE